MNNEEKILAMLTQMQDDLTHIKSRVGVVESVQVKMEAVQGKMRDDLTHIKARLDYDVDKRLEAINEGVDAIMETMVHKSRVEQLEDDVIVLKTAVKMLTQEVAELKKAQ